MSSVDSRWGPPQVPPPRPARPRPLVVVLAVVLPLLVLLAVVAPAGVLLATRPLRAGADPAGPTAPRSSTSPDAGLPGVGDPYFPDYGSSGYDALAYDIDVAFDPASGELTGRTTLTARATQRLESFFVDLALDVRSAAVDGAAARVDKQDFQDVQVVPAQPVTAGQQFEVTFDYAGRPADVRRDRTTAFLATGQEWMISGEPESSAWWFPANDHPSDPARMDVAITVPAGMEAVSVGALVSRDTGNDDATDTWHWVAEQPMATFLTFMAVGQYDIETGASDGRPFVYAVSQQLPADQRGAAMAALRTTPQVVRGLEQAFGPYPFSEIGGIVPAHDLPFDGLETQTRPIYKAGSIADEQFSAELIAHELAHMWFGDHVTVREWNDIFNSEAYASYAQWVYTAQTGGSPANDRLNRTFDRARGRADFWRISMSDPGPDNLFSAVYARGPMTLQALRNVMGDAAFDSFTRAWAAEAGSRSLEDWMARAQAASPVDLTAFFQAWIFARVEPARTPENGFR